ncbi:class I SAM-dependent methyltransferase [Aspergillus homomorphus CBS 101889]|uniref:Methyltransferase domain-containing protein n=1 Tax=Aspergillus homomorphus (strain CBS 101889) TaxID=1450537 RepID=A0A395I8B1_ASPHC|nr:hypothetical protein BO97DRAFT_459096 [Aspergillus homomorphus CBS 101889]RAL16039.1 hypothetical protein BO97DRAFT_459096 [Aspergillus homomorphus CBS 101889]
MTTGKKAIPPWKEHVDLGRLLNEGAGKFLEEYVHLSADELENHVRDIANQGWSIKAYPCFAKFLFLQFDLTHSPAYEAIIRHTQAGGLFLDLGCGLGQDIRRLAYDGAPGDRLIGLDLVPEFVYLGYQLFRDDATLQSRFLVQDFFEDTPSMRLFAKKIMAINSGFFMHLWSWKKQLQAAERMIQLLAPEKGAIVSGIHFGSHAPGVWDGAIDGFEDMFLHAPETLARLWEEAAAETGSRLKVICVVEEADFCKSLDREGCLLRWVVERL